MKIQLSKVGFKYAVVSQEDLHKIKSPGMCDNCLDFVGDEGRLVFVLNYILCPRCFAEWENRAKFYPQDVHFEDIKISHYSNIFK